MNIFKIIQLFISVVTIIYLIRLHLYTKRIRIRTDKNNLQLLMKKNDISIVLIIITVLLSIITYLID